MFAPLFGGVLKRRSKSLPSCDPSTSVSSTTATSNDGAGCSMVVVVVGFAPANDFAVANGSKVDKLELSTSVLDVLPSWLISSSGSSGMDTRKGDNTLACNEGCWGLKIYIYIKFAEF